MQNYIYLAKTTYDTLWSKSASNLKIKKRYMCLIQYKNKDHIIRLYALCTDYKNTCTLLRNICICPHVDRLTACGLIEPGIFLFRCIVIYLWIRCLWFTRCRFFLTFPTYAFIFLSSIYNSLNFTLNRYLYLKGRRT